jgi:hypothetical protein
MSIIQHKNFEQESVNMKVPNAIIYTLFDHYFGVQWKQEHMNTHPKQNKIENDQLFPKSIRASTICSSLVIQAGNLSIFV